MDKVIAFGEALIDMLSNRISGVDAKQETFTKFPGGAPANVAAAVARLGGRSYFAGKVGADMFGDFLIHSLREMGVHTDYMAQTAAAKTALAFVSLDASGERSFEFYRSPSADLLFRAEEFEPAWFNEPGVFHFCSNTLTEPGIRAATYAGIALARRHGTIVSFDVNLRTNLWHNDEYAYEAIWACLEQADMIKLCAEELAFVCCGQGHENVLDRLWQAGVKLVLVTDGGKPLRYFMPNSQGSIAPPQVTTVDSTAAGDAFTGGLLYALAASGRCHQGLAALISDRAERERLLRFASACGAFAVTRKGAFTSLPTQDQLQPLLAN